MISMKIHRRIDCSRLLGADFNEGMRLRFTPGGGSRSQLLAFNAHRQTANQFDQLHRSCSRGNEWNLGRRGVGRL